MGVRSVFIPESNTLLIPKYIDFILFSVIYRDGVRVLDAKMRG